MASNAEINPRLRRLLQRLPEEVSREFKREIREAGDVVEFEVLLRVPVDTGALARSLGRRTGSGGFSIEIGYSRKFGKRKWNLAGWRARFTELGTRGYTPDSQTKDGRTVYRRTTKGSSTTHLGTGRVPPRAPRPFLQPAYEAAKPQFIERLNRALETLLNKVGR